MFFFFVVVAGTLFSFDESFTFILPIAKQILRNLQNWEGEGTNGLRWYVGDTSFFRDVYGMCCTY